VIAVADLLEAEGRALRRGALRTGMGLACLGVAAVLLVAGICFCLWALFQWLVVVVGMPGAALLVGITFLLIAGGLAWTATRLSR
jgi:hypothetical protein